MVQSLVKQGISLPILMRFPDVIHSQVDKLAKSFHQAIQQANYRGHYRGVFPIKVNQEKSVVRDVIAAAKEKDIDYYSNTLLDQFPDGQDIEIFKFSALEYAWKHAKLSSEREHVTPFIKNNSSFKGKNLFKSDNHNCQFDYNKTRMVIDYPQDLEYTKFVLKYYKYFKPNNASK